MREYCLGQNFHIKIAKKDWLRVGSTWLTTIYRMIGRLFGTQY